MLVSVFISILVAKTGYVNIAILIMAHFYYIDFQRPGGEPHDFTFFARLGTCLLLVVGWSAT